MEAIVREAGLIALRRDINSKEVLADDFEQALEVVKPSVNEEVSKKYRTIENELKQNKAEEEALSMNSYI